MPRRFPIELAVDDILFVQGVLNEGKAQAVPVIREVLRHASSSTDTLIDAPPGASCPMVTVARAADIVLLVAKPTPFGLHNQVTGEWTISESAIGRLAHARLGAGGENSGKLVTQVRQSALQEAARTGASLLLIDGPPGIGCPVIAAATGAGLALLVTEPTPAAKADLERLLRMLHQFRIPAAAVINKSDLNPERSADLRKELEERGIDVLGEIPYDESLPLAQREGKLPIEVPGPAAAALREIHSRFHRFLHNSQEASGEVSGAAQNENESEQNEPEPTEGEKS